MKMEPKVSFLQSRIRKTNLTSHDLDFKKAMLEDFSAYHPDIKKVISIADNVSCWPLNIHDPLKTWVNGKMVLIGDAAHPVTPLSLPKQNL